MKPLLPALRRLFATGSPPVAGRWTALGLAVVFLLPLGGIFDLIGCLPPYLRLALVYGLLLLPLAWRPIPRAAVGALAVLLAMGLEAGFSPGPVAQLVALLLAHQAVWWAVGPVSLRLSAGVAVYGFLHVGLFLSPWGYPIAEGLADALGRIAGWLTGNAYHLGPTYQGLGGMLLFLCLSVAGWDRGRLAFGRTASFAGIALLLDGLLSLVLIRKVDFGADLVWELKYQEVFGYPQLFEHARGLALLLFPALIFVVQLAAYLVLHYEGHRKGGGATGATAGPPWLGWSLPHPAWAGALGAVAVIVAFLLLPPTAWRDPTPPEVVFVEKGVVSYTKPDYTRYGRSAGGMFGLLPEYARLFGCRATVVKDIPESLPENGVLVLTNLDAPEPAEVRERIWEFVRNGGGLWVLGDHTFIKNGRNHINDLLEPCGISLRHDSAQFFPQGWFNSYDFRQGTPFGLLRDPAENRPAILVGASLELAAPAEPFVLGRYGYSDWGTTETDEQRGYIGDFVYQAQERLGDLVLVAGQTFGAGRVLVFGDTTSFFCNNMPRSFEILRSSLSWFGEGRGWMAFSGTAARWLTGLVLVAGLALLLLTPRRGAVAGALGMLGLVAWIGQRPGGLLPFARDYSRQRLAIVDFSHQPEASKHSSMDNGLHGLTINLMRYGLLPVIMDEWDRELLDASRLLVVNAPRRTIDRAERRALDAFFARGGTFLLGCGFPHLEFCRDFLEPLHIGVEGVPLGRFFDRPVFGRPVSFFSAWPLRVANPQVAVICLYDTWPLIGVLPIGPGRLAVIGDSEMLLNRNVESMDNYDPNNIQFIKSILDYTVGPPGS
ncbi:MAG: hypothetical protein H7A45_21090 [Verrucomicrobiales bacterium]|nr:hypothetical protein [Verrucomicrobiales bacterium]